jgi:zinc-finger of transposase IS204/IS1001/IS1096/IS1165
MRATTLLSKILGLKATRVRSVSCDDEGLVVQVVPTTRIARCSGCMCRVHAVHDRRERDWRHLDVGPFRLRLRYAIRRVDCPRCGVVVEFVPWAESQSWFTYDFEEQVAYLAQRADKTTLSALMRIAWARARRPARSAVRSPLQRDIEGVGRRVGPRGVRCGARATRKSMNNVALSESSKVIAPAPRSWAQSMIDRSRQELASATPAALVPYANAAGTTAAAYVAGALTGSALGTVQVKGGLDSRRGAIDAWVAAAAGLLAVGLSGVAPGAAAHARHVGSAAISVFAFRRTVELVGGAPVPSGAALASGPRVQRIGAPANIMNDPIEEAAKKLGS